MSSDQEDVDVEIEDLRRMNHFPPHFEEWPREHQADYLRREFRRSALVARILAVVGLDPDRELTTNARLTKTELAAVYLELKHIPSRTSQ